MATKTPTLSVHATLSISTVDTCTFQGGDPAEVEVLNRGTTDPIYFTVGGATPTVAGDDTYVVLPGQGLVVDGSGVVKLISAGAMAYSVTRVS